MILEVAVLDVKTGQGADFERTFREASAIIAASPGYINHELQACIEKPDRYILLVRWQSLEAHTVGFRGSAAYEDWKRLLHNFYDPFPVVEHYQSIVDRT
jgi:heme-degrading monooxygenase HmoA